MGKFWEGAKEIAKQPLEEGQFLFDVARGKTSLKDAPGAHQEMMTETLKPWFGDNTLTQNSDAIAGAIVGGILAAPVMAGAAGAGAGGTGLAGSMGAGASGLTFTGLGGGGAATATGVGTGATYTGTLGSLGTTIGSYTAPVMETMSQYGGMLDYASQGLDLYNAATGGQQQAPQAPAFRPSFQRSNSTGMADQLMQQEMQGGYGQLNINQYR